LKNKCCLYVIISIRFFSITICNLLIEFPSYLYIKNINYLTSSNGGPPSLNLELPFLFGFISFSGSVTDMDQEPPGKSTILYSLLHIA